MEEFDNQRRLAAEDLNFGTPQSQHETVAWLKRQLTRGAESDSSWADRWLDAIAWSAGFEASLNGAGARFIEKLRREKRFVVAICEGLEELYDKPSTAGVSEMMKGLLLDLPQRLRSERSLPLGLITYVRRDTVEAAVTQNLDQFRREYAAFALRWSDEDVLELAAWLASKSGALPNLWNDHFRLKSPIEKASALEPLWGRKLGQDDVPGKPRVKEAYVATWIIAVLSDLQGRLVPRDLVRLLSSASGATSTGEDENAYSTRLLTPKALREAIDPTSAAKVSEAEEEIIELKPIFTKFRHKPDQMRVPIDPESVKALGLTDTDIDTLQRHGILFGEAPPYEVPELYRRGLRLRHTGARHSVVNLYRRARQRSSRS